MSYSSNGVDPNSSYQGLSEDAEPFFRRAWRQPAMSVVMRYGSALIFVSLALVLAQTFLYFGLPQPFTAFALSAIAITFWSGGTNPGILAALIAWLIRDHLFEPEVSAEARVLYGLVFLVFALVMSLVMRGRKGLEARVSKRTAELTKTNEDLRLEIARHKATEEALRRSEAYLAEAQRLSHTGTWALNDTRVLYWSEEGYRIWGLDPRQGLPSKETMWQRLHPDDRGRVYEEVQAALRQKTHYAGEFRILPPDGTVKYLQATSHHVFSESGDFLEAVGTHVDVTKRKRDEESIRESAYKLRKIIETVPGLLWSTGPDGEPTHFNQRILDYSGMRLEDFKQRGWEAFLHPDDFAETAKAFYHAIQTGTSYQAVHRLRRADGEFLWYQARGEPLRDQQGRIIQWYGLSVDIDEAKKAEDRLRRIEAHLAEAQRLSHTGASVFNETTILYWSDETYRIWGFDPAEGTPSREAVLERIHPDDRDRVWAEAEGSFGERKGPIGYRIVLPDGTGKHLESISEPVFSASGELIEVVATHLDVTERKHAENALRESEYRLRQIIETVPGLVWSNGPDGEPTHINQRMLDYSGKRFEDFEHHGWEAFVHPADYPETAKSFYQAIQTGTSYEAVQRLRRSDGEFRWHHARCEPLRDQQGRVIQWYGLSVDIDERKKAEDLLRRSEAHLAEAQRLSRTGASAYNATTNLYWSEETYRIFGFDPRDGLPDREAVWQRVHPDDRSRVRAEVERAQNGKGGLSSQFRIALPDGTIKYVESIRQPVFSANGELVEVVATQIDVTERKRAEQALRDSEAKFRDYAETASDWFWEIGPDYKFTLLTENAFGSRPADRIGTACWDNALDLKTEPQKWQLIRETLDSRQSFRDFVYCSAGHDGSPMYVRASGKPMFDANEEFRGYRGTGTDVTAITRAHRVEASLRTVQAELAHASRVTTLGQLTASIAHEITQPIAAARNNARAAVNFLDKLPADLGEVREALDCIVADADRAGDIIDRIRDHIKKAPPRSNHVDLNTAINEVIVLARSEITKNGVLVQTRLTEGLLPVKGDRVQLQQVIMNLILNAVEALSAVGAGARELFVSAEQSEVYGVLVAVRDSGPGIDPVDLDRVFEAFYTTKSSGVGIGLSICRSIIEAHGGRLWAEGNETCGVAFKFTLPCADLMNSDQAAQHDRAPRGDRLTDPFHQLAYEGSK